MKPSSKIQPATFHDNILTFEEWSAWKTHPVTQMFFRYISDSLDAVGLAVGQQVANGIIPEHNAIMRDAMQCEALNFVLETEAETINQFYQTEKTKEEENNVADIE